MRATLVISRRCETPSTPISSTQMFIFNCAVNECPFQKALDYPKILTHTFFPLPPDPPAGDSNQSLYEVCSNTTGARPDMGSARVLLPTANAEIRQAVCVRR
jgi:hypothetical protein